MITRYDKLMYILCVSSALSESTWRSDTRIKEDINTVIIGDQSDIVQLSENLNSLIIIFKEIQREIWITIKVMNLTLLSFVIKSLTLILFRDDNKLSSTEVISSRIILGMIVDSSFLIILYRSFTVKSLYVPSCRGQYTIPNSIVIEQVFGIPGMGRTLISSISKRDYPVVEAIIVLIAVVILVINMITDLMYKVLDKRIEI